MPDDRDKVDRVKDAQRRQKATQDESEDSSTPKPRKTTGRFIRRDPISVYLASLRSTADSKTSTPNSTPDNPSQD